MSFDSEEVHGSKLHQSKDHMSLLLCTNMNGSEKLNPVVIGKAAHPTALKKHGVIFKDLGIEYFWNQKGWMQALSLICGLQIRTTISSNKIVTYFCLLTMLQATSLVSTQHQNLVPTTQYYSKVTAPRSRYH